VGAEVRRWFIAVALIVGLAGAAGAGARTDSPTRLVTQHDQRDVAATVYSGDLGFIKDVREVSLAAGNAVVQFTDVAARLDPSSVDFRSLTDPTGLRVLEQSYEYDLVSNQKLLEKYVGRKVRLYQPNGSYVEATLLSATGPIYEINGQIHLGQPGNVVLPALPEHLVLKPTLVWLLRNRTTGLHRIEASYLTVQKDWRAISPGLSEVEWEISFRNQRDEDVTVTVMEPVPGDWEVLRATHPHDKADAHTLRFRIPVPKGGAAKLGYRVRVKF
jgi:hypothetical protein